MTAGRLARESGLSSGALTTLLDRLESRGYVRRVRDTEDRRRIFIEMTDEARRRAWEIWGPIGEAESFYAGYSDEQLAQLLDFLRQAQEFLARHRGRIESMLADRGGADGSAPVGES